MTLQEKYNAINEGAFSKQQFLRDARLAFPQIITQFNSYEDASQILKNKGIIGEAEKKVEPVKFDPADKIAPDVLDQGIKAELEKKGLPVNQTPTSEEYAAAKKKAVANITKDLLYYKNAQTMASSKSEKMEKAKVKLTEIKKHPRHSDESVNEGRPTPKVGDLVGNTVQGFNFKLLGIEGSHMEVQDEKTGIKFKTHIDNMYVPSTSEAKKEPMKEAEGGADTSWTGIDNETITLQDILELTKDIKTQNFPTKELASIVLNWDNNPEEIERISQVEVSSQYPILIMVDEQGKIQWILDGNHRAQKALSAKAETIPAKLIKPSNLNSKARKILLGIVDERLKKETANKPMKPQLKESHVRKLAELILEAKLAEEMSVHGELQRILDTDTPKVAQGAAIALEALKKFYAASENLTRKLEKAYKITGPFMAPALGAAVVKQINDIVTKPYKAEMPKAKMVNIAKINDFETLAKETGISVEDLKNMQRQFKTGMTALPTVNESKKRNTKSLATLLETQTNTTDISNVMNVREVGEETYFLDNREVEVLDFDIHDSGNGYHRIPVIAKFVDTGNFLTQDELETLSQESFESDYVSPFDYDDADRYVDDNR